MLLPRRISQAVASSLLLFSIYYASEASETVAVHAQRQQQDATVPLTTEDDAVANNDDALLNQTNQGFDAQDPKTAAATKCGIWLAPSTIPGAGLGMYAGRDFGKDEALQANEGDVVIPIPDLRWHTGNDEFIFLFDEYTWNAETLKMDQEGMKDINVVSPGFGSAANSFLPLQNVEEWNPHFDAAGLHRSTDPGAGGFTLYVNRTSTATRDILAGEEFFVSYGEQWFTGRAHYMGAIPLTNDLDRATKLFATFQKLACRNRVDADILEQVWNFSVVHTAFTESSILSAYNHSDPAERQGLLENKNLVELRIQQSIRSVEWLQENGACGDHLQAGRSTLHQAGRGAFASRHLPQGTLVSHLPLVHVGDRSVFAMYHFRETETEDGRIEQEPDKTLGIRSYQLLLNYCFGHEQSSLLLCPYGPIASLVNHNQTQANVRLQWSTRGNHMPQLLEQEIEQLDQDYTAKLAMDLVAIRDIQPGDEVFLDYGDAWEAAWQAHLQAWQAPQESEDYITAQEMNEDKELRLMTEFEVLEYGYIANLELWCNNAFIGPRWKRYYFDDNMDEFHANAQGKIYRCDLLRYRQEDDDILYTAIMWYEDLEKGRPLEYIGKLVDVPRDAFLYYDLPYTTDIHLPQAFRKEIGIPDSIFPEAWKNYESSQ